MFRHSARFYDALYSWKDYAGECDRLRELIAERAPGARTMLDVACGTGLHLALLRDYFEVEGADLDPEMLAIAAERLPGVPLHEADMVMIDLGREFDVVTCLFSSVGYTVTVERLRQAFAVARAACGSRRGSDHRAVDHARCMAAARARRYSSTSPI